jgi:carbon monoxide dehydrogenase subunit G
MKLHGELTCHAPRERLWALLNDPSAIRRHLPGCTALEALGGDEFAATLDIAVATLRGAFSARLKIRDRVPARGYRLEVSGEGPAGSVSGGGTVALAEYGLGTQLSYRGELAVTGLIATIGQRFLAGVAQRMADDFFGGLSREAEQEGPGSGGEC